MQIVPNFTERDSNATGRAPIQSGTQTFNDPLSEMTVSFPVAFPDTNFALLVTLESDYEINVYHQVTKTAGGFTVTLSSSFSSPITVNWLAVRV